MRRELRPVLGFAACFGLLAVVAGAFVNQTRGEVALRTEENHALTRDVERLAQEAALMEELVQRLDDLKGNVARFVTILPAPELASEEHLLRLVQEHCERSQASLLSWRRQEPRERARSSRRRAAFEEVGLRLELSGNFNQVLEFVNGLERHKSLVRVNRYELSYPGAPLVTDGVEPLKVTLELSTFRYDPPAHAPGPPP